MVFSTKKTSEIFVTEAEKVDLTKATYADDLSLSFLDEENSSFSVTTDRVNFLKPLKVILTVLEHNGFASNFENILSCFDSLVQGLRIRVLEKTNNQNQLQAKNFMPCLSFKLPSKDNAGFLLKKFYGEIEAYELELAQLRKAESGQAIDKAQSREQMKREIERWQGENAKLQMRIEQLSSQLAMAIRSQAHVEKALETNNIIPPQLKSVVVREVNFKDRFVLMKSGRSSFQVPMALIDSVPRVGDPCLISFKGDHISDVFFYESIGQAFVRELADVLHVSDQTCKIRGSSRRTYLWTVKSDWEAEVFAGLRRGSKLIISTIDDIIVKINRVVEQSPGIWSQIVQEKQTVFQLERARSLELIALSGQDRKES